jgi:hypothetical protein
VRDHPRQGRLDAGQRRFDILIDGALLAIHLVVCRHHAGHPFQHGFVLPEAFVAGFVCQRPASPTGAARQDRGRAGLT